MTGVFLLIDIFFVFFNFKMYEKTNLKFYQICGFIYLGFIAVILWKSTNTFETSLIKGWLS
ncbi:hypothetical protein ABD91_21500 [Lysinibacillus sphaericus]|uniref:hypothetical protein n=1 Tax=Lysinibacillus sphaericus TaxID=1421 RepID=UPI0018CD6799|nr:hypothetical protein [Lysinibacillus sphaericus]MBG9693314.1 hypothetical protein [Lysinibacillus sphaericus]